MTMPLRPILVSLRHHKLIVSLLILQVAFTCAIICNVVFLVTNRIQQIMLPSGIAEAELTLMTSESVDKSENHLARHRADLVALRGIAGVIDAVAVDSLPLGSSETSSITCVNSEDMQRIRAASSLEQAGCVQPAVYTGTPSVINVLGLRLIAGRDFSSEEYVTGDMAPVVIISRALAEKLYPGQPALGKNIYVGVTEPSRVIGVVDTLLRPRINTIESSQYTVLQPILPDNRDVTYLLRSASQGRHRLLQIAVGVLMRAAPDRIISSDSVRTYEDVRYAYFQRDDTMIGLLLASGIGLLFVTALGIAGLANFWVAQRRKQIGIRRAIGATRDDILRYFQLENFLIVSIGIIFGMTLAFGLNQLLMQKYELPRLPLCYLLIGAFLLWVLGQLAVLAPALRAAAISPMAATRSL
jgi:putative ABC transport system permease protein